MHSWYPLAAGQRLCLWHPLAPCSQHSLQLSDEDLKHIKIVMAHAWELDTHTTHASGLLSFLVFCDKRSIPEKGRVPEITPCFHPLAYPHYSSNHPFISFYYYVYICFHHLQAKTNINLSQASPAHITPPNHVRKLLYNLQTLKLCCVNIVVVPPTLDMFILV